MLLGVLVTEHISAEGLLGEERSEERIFLTDMEKQALQAIANDGKIKYSALAENLGIGETSVYKIMKHLKELGLISRKNGKSKGEWTILKK